MLYTIGYNNDHWSCIEPVVLYVYEFAKQRGEPVKSSINEPIEKFLSERGFYKIKNMGSDYKKVYFYGKNANREVNDMASFVYAVVE
ncbi:MULTISPECIES: hypothetical protein [Methanobacterium]|uniref:Uncharacterized protein n=1 Tax=Methanobacterium veterum TaxID=408577 RepID=A0A9E5A233_9EURY|nr:MULTISPECIES: hypothetical protein [Methanobacterium]MCZ3366650.1 hypothetical protein [Methanobacterium veterum]MCZ3374205.1 hypothetical protein [Methanobacterium veterum]